MNRSLVKGVVWGLLVIAVAVWAANRSLQPSSAPQVLPESASFHQTDVSDVMIRRGTAAGVHLQRKGKQWLLLGAQPASKQAADSDAVAHLLADLATMKVVRVVSHHAEYFSQLSLDEKRGVHVTLQNPAGEILLDIWVGKPASDLVSTYVRWQEKPESVAVNRSLTWQVRRLPEAWKAKKSATPKPEAPAIQSADHYSDKV